MAEVTRLLMVGVLLLSLFPLAGCGVAPSCTVGMAGTDLEVTFQGWDSTSQCNDFIKSAGQSGYRRDVDPTSTLMCRVTVGQDVVTVRDRGVLKVYGNATCATLQAQAGG